MTEHDGLTAEQEAKWRWPEAWMEWGNPISREAFVAGAEWATEREKARAEAAEARVAELERELELARMGAAAIAGTLDRVTADGVATRAENERLREELKYAANIIAVARPDMVAHQEHWQFLTTPTTEAVTEVEGS